MWMVVQARTPPAATVAARSGRNIGTASVAMAVETAPHARNSLWPMHRCRTASPLAVHRYRRLPKAVLDTLAGIQTLDVHFPTTDGRKPILTRHTEPNADQKVLLRRVKLDLPSQPPPRMAAPVGNPVHAAATAEPV